MPIDTNAWPRAVARVALLLLGAAAGCSTPPFGEVLVVVDTDVSVPEFASRLRIDLFDEQQTWYESRDVTTLAATAWPVSFSLFTDAPAGKRVRLRLRAYPEAGSRDYRGERLRVWPPFHEPHASHDLAEMCADPPVLPMGQTITLRRAALGFDAPISTSSCRRPAGAGSAAVKVMVPAAGEYRFEVLRAQPDGASGDIRGDTTLYLRTVCDQRATQLACNDDADANTLLSRVIVTLQPGIYYLITGGAVASPADLTIAWGASASFPPAPPPAGGTDGGTAGDTAGPRLIVGSVDVTPAHEPEPGLTIDRLVDLAVSFGGRSTARLLLTGDCLGVQADLAGAQSCVATVGTREPVVPAVRTDGIDRGGPSRSGTWTGEQSVPCTVAPRPSSGLLDEEVCVPGGAFPLGASQIRGFGVNDAQPGQVAVVEPFLIDRYEVTVGRVRRALHDGFVPPDASPFANDHPANFALYNSQSCTFNGDANGPAPGVDREKMPVNCVSWYTARALCQFWGGDLSGHVQWEYAAAAAGRAAKKDLYPWGDGDPTCAFAIFDRAGSALDCRGSNSGPVPVDAQPSTDATPLGLVGMAGNLSEWSLDSFRPYSDSCWWQAPLYGVGCREEEAPLRSNRGGNWFLGRVPLRLAFPGGFGPGVGDPADGFRCVRKGTP